MSSAPGEHRAPTAGRESRSPLLPLDPRSQAWPPVRAAARAAAPGPPCAPPVGPVFAPSGRPAPAGAGRPASVRADDTVHLHGAQDTLQVIANADRWAQLTHALDEARVPLAVGDVDAMRRLAKLEQPVLDALTRWIGTANRGWPGGPGRTGGG